MIDVKQFRYEVVRPTLTHLALWSQAAENLLVGTALKESGLRYLKQIGGGPALGLYQIEPATHMDLFDNYLRWRPTKKCSLMTVAVPDVDLNHQLITNLAYATGVARLIYYRVSEAMPDADDIEGLAAYWKTYYNTIHGAGHAHEWVKIYRKYHGKN